MDFYTKLVIADNYSIVTFLTTKITSSWFAISLFFNSFFFSFAVKCLLFFIFLDIIFPSYFYFEKSITGILTAYHIKKQQTNNHANKKCKRACQCYVCCTFSIQHSISVKNFDKLTYLLSS